MTSTRRLVLVRHATAAPAGAGGDEARDLTPQGFDEARALGAWLAERHALGDAVVCSPAARTRQTWAAIDEETSHGVLITMEQGVYEAGTQELLEIVRLTEPDVETLVLVGHAPGIPMLALDLCDGDGDADALAQLRQGFAPASCAVVSFDGPWADVALGAGALEAFRTGTLS